MKRISRYYFLLPGIFAWAACAKDTPTFGNDTGVYIDKSIMPNYKDSFTYSFAIKPDDRMQDTIYLPVRITGVAAARDRLVALSAVKDSTTAVEGQHYTLPPCTLKADSFSTRFVIVVKRTPDLKTQEVRLQLQVVPNKDFPLKITQLLSGDNPYYLIKLNDKLTKPDKWEARGSWLQTFFGNYSEVKFKFIILVTGKSDWPPRGRDGANAPNLNDMYNYSSMLHEALRLYEAAHGPMMDENGNRVVFP